MFILAFINLCSTLYVHSWFTFCMTSFLLLENTIHTIYKYLPNNAKKCINCSHYIFLQFKTLKSKHRSRVYLHNTLKSFKKTTGNSVVHHEKACEPQQIESAYLKWLVLVFHKFRKNTPLRLQKHSSVFPLCPEPSFITALSRIWER